MESLKLRVEVLVLVCAVRERVKTYTVGVVRLQVAESDRIPSFVHICNFQGDDLVSETLGACRRRLVIYDEVSDGESLRVQEKFLVVSRHLVQVEVDSGLTHKGVALLQREAEVILNLANKFTALDSLLLRKEDTGLIILVNDGAATQVLRDEGLLLLSGLVFVRSDFDVGLNHF